MKSPPNMSSPRRTDTRSRTAVRQTELRVERLVPGGQGLVRVDGEVRFVDAVLPNELVAVTWEGRAKPRALSLKVLESSPLRVREPCVHASSCGGCDWLHIEPAAQADFHRSFVEDLLSRALKTQLAIEVRRPTEPLAYRSRARLHFTTHGRRVALGYFGERTHRVVSVESCAVLEDGLFAAAHEVAAAFAEASSNQADLEGEISVAWGLRASQEKAAVFDITLTRDPSGAAMGRLDQLVAAKYAGARVSLSGAAAPMVIGDPRPVQRAADGLPLWIAAGGFAQASDAGAIALSNTVVEVAAPAGKTVFELHAGSGTLSVGLAKDAASFSSVESASAAVQCAKENFTLRGLSGKLRVSDADALAIPAGLDLVVLDPPRQGARKVCENIARARPKKVVYVSCDPATLARDLEVLGAANYVAERVVTLELFPQTSHVETVVALTRAARGKA